ncbi:uncharacterized protein LOC110449847 [Mizuhopecten yessoensis]|uniref:Uncharacterized protein n=1 Tax=Mizuhopecten yessoensis TaxID=6573 RepID=A0A210QQI2_MIZYE|nr:uncharacterized protein LOC110449847 [Mizuhopecten yessoensis]OWF50948.1 hypothetical protein KP79_PYT07472 [Mizuhopecten yessoensis]
MLSWGTLLYVLSVCAAQRYPITAAWFSDHLSRDNWNETLANFTKNGGDTVLVKAPQFQFRSQHEMEADPDFAWCGTTATNTGPTCFADAKKEMNQLGFKIASFASYKSGENFSDVIVACPAFEKKFDRARTYFRLVLPTTVRPQSQPCDLPTGSSVVVLFTSFAGVDSNELLVRTAAERNMSVYLGIPEAPDTLPNHQYMGAYYEWFSRLLVDHQQRYSGIVLRKSKYKTAYDAVTGYNSGDALPLGDCSTVKDALILYSTQGNTVHHHGKKFLVSASVDLRKTGGYSIDDHVHGLNALVSTSVADVMNIHEGRGFGKSCYYWPTQNALPISQVDKTLDEVLHYQNPQLKPNVTFDDFFFGSIQQLMESLFIAREGLQKNGSSFDMWLNIEAFEFLQDNPCLPTSGTGISITMDRVTKGRLDMALSAGAVFVQKVSVSAWNPDFTCIPKNSSSTLAQQVYNDAGRPIIANCSFHSQYNRSVVVIGFNLLGETQGFTVTWSDIGHTRHNSDVNGYYFEADFGSEHHLVPSLIYTQLYDPYNSMQLNPKGTVRVKARGANRACVFTYDYTKVDNETGDK